MNIPDRQIAKNIKETRSEAFADLQSAQSRINSTESKGEVQQEIETIRKKITDNEKLLRQAKESTGKAERIQDPPIEDTVNTPREEDHRGYGYYVYSIVGGDSAQPIEELPEEGIDPGYPVYALPYQGIQAIVSKVSLGEFGQAELEANLNDMKWVEAKVYAQQGVLEKVLASRTLIPMRFCAIYRSKSRLQEMLAWHYDDFVAALARVEGKQEWGVKIYCDSETLAKQIEETSDRVKDLKKEMASKSSGAAYFLKKKLEETVAQEMDSVSDDYAQRSHDRLANYAKEFTVNPLQSKEITGKKERMLLNGAYLVTEEEVPAFRAEFESLGKEYGDLGFSYEMTGPWPPYNFVTIDFARGASR